MRRRFKKARRPYRRFKRSFYRRRNAHRRHRKPGRISRRSEPLLLPDRLQTKLKWSINVLATLNGAGLAVLNLFGNGPYDPDGGGTPLNQPTGWDQYSAFYDRYYCSGSKIKMEVTNVNNDLGAAADPTVSDALVGLIPSNNIVTTSNLTTTNPSELPYAQEKTVAPFPGHQYRVLKKYMSTKKMFGQPGCAYNPDFQGIAGNTGVGSNPNNLWWWNAYFVAPAGAAATGKKYRVRLWITFYVTFYRRNQLTIS